MFRSATFCRKSASFAQSDGSAKLSAAFSYSDPAGNYSIEITEAMAAAFCADFVAVAAS